MSSTVAGSSAALTLDLISKENYIATYLNPEKWNDARRYDYKYKDFTLPVGGSLSNVSEISLHDILNSTLVHI